MVQFASLEMSAEGMEAWKAFCGRISRSRVEDVKDDLYVRRLLFDAYESRDSCPDLQV